MPTVLVLGGSGFIGTALTSVLQLSGSPVITVSRSAKTASVPPQDHIVLDVSNQSEQLASLIAQIQPACIINLVGGRNDGVWEYARRVYRLCWTLIRTRTEARLLLIGSAAEYGVPTTLPVDEHHPLNPTSGYGLSRAIQSWVARTMWEEHRLPVTVARLFNVIGPGQDDTFVAGTIVQQAVDVRTGVRPQIAVGDIHAVRDFIDIRDAVRALAWLALHGAPGEAYNVCSGRPTSVEELLRRTGALAGLSGEYYQTVEDRVRNDPPCVYGSHLKLTAESGWTPLFDVERSLADMLSDERNRRLRHPV